MRFPIIRRHSVETTACRVACLMIISSSLACSDNVLTNVTGTSVRPTRVFADASIPDRSSDSPRSFHRLTDDTLWKFVASGKGLAIVGIKTPGQARGVYKNEILIGRAERTSYVNALSHLRGVHIVEEHPVLPTVELQFDDFAAFSVVRALPFVDYLEPTAVAIPMDGSTCGDMNLYSTSSSDIAFSALGDVIPWYYQEGYNNVVNAWNRTQGANTKVGVLDTGIDPGQDQFFSRFNAYPDPNLTRQESIVTPDECGHGTRVAGVIAAPQDGQNMMGIAWKSDLVVEKTGTDVLPAGHDVYFAIWFAYNAGAKVIEMAFKTDNYQACTGDPYSDCSGSCYFELQPDGTYAERCLYFSSIADEISYLYYQSNGPLFVAAAGTVLPVGVPNVFFPAELPEVIAVNGMNRDGSRQSSSNYGSKIEFAGYVNAAAPGAGSKGSTGVVDLGGSSGGSASVAGIALLTWAAHPTWSNVDVRSRLRFSAQHPYDQNTGNGFGAINAYRAVGGFEGFRIDGETCETQFTINTPVELNAVASGDGPFDYLWSTGETTGSISVQAGQPGETVDFFVTVTDRIENLHRTVYHDIYTLPANDTRIVCSD